MQQPAMRFIAFTNNSGKEGEYPTTTVYDIKMTFLQIFYIYLYNTLHIYNCIII